MSLNEVALVAGGLAVGASAGALGLYLYMRNSLQKKNSTSLPAARRINFEDVDDLQIQRLVSKPELEKTKRELRTLTLERNLVSAGLTRLYEAEVAQEITREERETLALKYREELKTLDEKISKIDSFIEVGDLETLREQLLDLVSQKMEAIERRIERASRSAPLLAQIVKPTVKQSSEPAALKETPKPEATDISNFVSNEGEVGINQTGSKEKASETQDPKTPLASTAPRKKPADAQVDELQKELLEALDRLEKLDVEN